MSTRIFFPRFVGVIRYKPEKAEQWVRLTSQLKDIVGIHIKKGAIFLPVISVKQATNDHPLIFLQPDVPIDYYQMVIGLKKNPDIVYLFLDSQGQEIKPILSKNDFIRYAFPCALVVSLDNKGNVRICWIHLQTIQGDIYYREEVYFEDVLPITLLKLESSLLSVPKCFQDWVRKAYHRLQQNASLRRVHENRY